MICPAEPAAAPAAAAVSNSRRTIRTSEGKTSTKRDPNDIRPSLADWLGLKPPSNLYKVRHQAIPQDTRQEAGRKEAGSLQRHPPKTFAQASCNDFLKPQHVHGRASTLRQVRKAPPQRNANPHDKRCWTPPPQRNIP